MKKSLLVALGLCMASLTPSFAEPTQFGPGTKIGLVTGLPKLTSGMRRGFNKFRREANYFAAFAVNHDTGHWFYIQNFHELNRVKTAAIEGCRQLSESSGCALYAVAIPKNLPASQSNAKGFSLLAYKDFNSAYTKHRKPGTYAAFAISGASHHGYGNAYETIADAKDTAVSYCQIGVAKDMAELGPQARKFARARGWQNCKVVDVVFTPAD